MQHCTIADAGYGAAAWRVEQRLQLVTGEIADECLVGLLHGDRVDSSLVKARRHSIDSQ
jgi:hypothetical protein